MSAAVPAVDCETFGIGYCEDIKKLTNFEHSLLNKIKKEDLIDLVKDLKIESNFAQKASALLETVSPFSISFLILSQFYILTSFNQVEDKFSTIVTSLIRIFLKKILEFEEHEVEGFVFGKKLRHIVRNFIWDKAYNTSKLVEQEKARGRRPWQYIGYGTSSCKAALVAYGVNIILYLFCDNYS